MNWITSAQLFTEHLLNARWSAGKSRWKTQVAGDSSFYCWTLLLLAAYDRLFWPLWVHVFLPQTLIYLTDLSAHNNQIIHICHKHAQQWAHTQASIWRYFLHLVKSDVVILGSQKLWDFSLPFSISYIKLGGPTFARWIFTIVVSFWCTFLFPHSHSSSTLLVRLSLTYTLSCIIISIAACLGLLCSDSQFLGHSSTEMYFLGTEDNQRLFLNPWAHLHLLTGALKSYGLYLCWARFAFSRGLLVIVLIGCIMGSSFLPLI